MVTKRQLGILSCAAGLVIIVGLVAIYLAGAGQWAGFGPLQRLGVAAGLALIVIGGLLFRLGDRPA